MYSFLSILWKFISVGQRNSLINYRAWVQVPQFPFKTEK
nr:MAG TPA: hypothetical protein [Caudoviricetes sp.]